MNKLLKIFAIMFFLVFLYFLGKIAYTFSGKDGESTTINESLKRGTFVCELDFYAQIDGDKQFVNIFFIEKKFKYGKFSTSKTSEIGNELQLVMGSPFDCKTNSGINYNCETGRHDDFSGYFLKLQRRQALKNLNDTLNYIIYLTESGDSIGNVEVFLPSCLNGN